MNGIHPLRDRVFRPWKNGGGDTAEIVVSPPGAGFDDFEWRISTALVASDGPFSRFPGVDRVLTVIEGGPMALTIDGHVRQLDEHSSPLAFPGDAPCEARLCGPPLLDFNLMLRRPLAAQVRKGPLRPAGGRALARLALLLEDRAGLSRLDLVDLDAAAPRLAAALTGVQAISVEIGG
ncbi:HutD/Ves family protein [Paracoccus luteus]|uniref:HutD/Ves family protein n=1 Tax=Paracoccus luteus TaxID=2508543 RepID=UPI001C6FEDDB|nr:HutD family protein [Paracoccus luteus]